eukprot:231974-Prymnesium_polylepis.1
MSIRQEWVQWLCHERFLHELLDTVIPPPVLWFCAKGRLDDDGRVTEILATLRNLQICWPNGLTFDIGGMDSRLARLKSSAMHLPADVALAFLLGAKCSGHSLMPSDEMLPFAFTLVWNTQQQPEWYPIPGLPEFRTLTNEPATEIYPGTPDAVRESLDETDITAEWRDCFLQVAHTYEDDCLDNTIYVEATGRGALHMLHVAEGGNLCSSVGFSRPTIDNEP